MALHIYLVYKYVYIKEGRLQLKIIPSLAQISISLAS